MPTPSRAASPGQKFNSLVKEPFPRAFVIMTLGAPPSAYRVTVTNTDGVDAEPFSSTSAFQTCSYLSSALTAVDK